MKNYIIIAIVLVIIGVGVFNTVRNLASKKSCCSSGDYKPKKKKLSDIKYTKTFRVEGMHCDHCKGRVEETVNDIKGVAGRVDLKKGELTVSYAEEVDDEVIISHIERIGYRIV